MTRLFLWIAALAATAVYLAMILWTLPHLSGLAGELPMFDMRPGGYTPDEARAIIAALGDEGRAFYLDVQHRLDIAFPVLMAVTLALAYGRLFRPAIAIPLGLLAVTGAGFDLLENAAVAGLLHAGPDGISDQAVIDAARWTVLKSVANTASYAALVAGIGAALWWRVKSRAT